MVGLVELSLELLALGVLTGLVVAALLYRLVQTQTRMEEQRKSFMRVYLPFLAVGAIAIWFALHALSIRLAGSVAPSLGEDDNSGTAEHHHSKSKEADLRKKKKLIWAIISAFFLVMAIARRQKLSLASCYEMAG